MKWTKKRILYNLLELVFAALVPLLIIIASYSNIGSTSAAVGFRLSMTGIVLCIIIFLIVKRLVFDRKINDMHEQLNLLIADLKTESNSAKKANLEYEIKAIKTIETVLSSILPLLFFTAVMVACKALEAGIIKLFGAVGFIFISYILGTVFSILAAREVTGKAGD